MAMRIQGGSRASRRAGSVCQRSNQGAMMYLVRGLGPLSHCAALRDERAIGAGVCALSCFVHVEPDQWPWRLLCNKVSPLLTPRVWLIASGAIDALCRCVSPTAIRRVQHWQWLEADVRE